jgi:hypothetical protein
MCAEGGARGERPPAFGPEPGFRFPGQIAFGEKPAAKIRGTKTRNRGARGVGARDGSRAIHLVMKTKLIPLGHPVGSVPAAGQAANLASTKRLPVHPHDVRPLIAESGALQRVRARRPQR